MKIAISSQTGNHDKPFSPRFGRCGQFVITDSNGSDWEAVTNPAVNARGGSGTQVVQFLADHNVDVVISGRFGPNAFDALEAAGIEAYLASSGTPSQLLEKYLAGSLNKCLAPSGQGMHQKGRRGWSA